MMPVRKEKSSNVGSSSLSEYIVQLNVFRSVHLLTNLLETVFINFIHKVTMAISTRQDLPGLVETGCSV